MNHGGVDPRDQQEIAAFIEQRMSAEERRAFLKRLDEEDDLYEVFVETVRYRDQQAAPVYDLGQWVEAGVLASRGGNRDLLRSRAFRKALRGFPRHEWGRSNPRLAGQLDEVEDLLQAPGERLDLARLEEVFTAIAAAR